MIRNFEDAERVLAEALPGYAPRPQQQLLAQAVEGLLSTLPAVAQGAPIRHLMAQAGCGVGKSLGSLIPSILSGERIIYATATKALQEQIAGKDLPFLEKHLPVNFTWALLKGKSNYACLSKLAEITPDQLAPHLIKELREELEDETHTGDFEHLKTPLPADKQYLLSMSTDECPGRSTCPFGEMCFSEKAKEAARKADIVVTNTAMLMVDIRVRNDTGNTVDILGEYGTVVIDEAHELPEIAQNAMSQRLRLRGLLNLVSQADGFLHAMGGKDMSNQIHSLKAAGQEIFEYLEALITQSGENVLPLMLGGLEVQIDNFVELIEGLKVLEKAVSDAQTTGQNDRARQLRLSRKLLNMSNTVLEFLTTEDNMVRWIEIEDSRRGDKIVSLMWSPVDVGPFLRKGLWERLPVIMVSATLAIGGNFSYMMETMGLYPNAVVSMDVGTPFDYQSQARLFIPSKDKPVPSGQTKAAWTTYAQTETRDLIMKAGGGALLLFTSRKAMQDAYKMLTPQLNREGLTCLMQGQDGTNKEIAQRFSEDTHSVLFALKSFFTGVDFQGETCRLVVIDKMPFAVPTDVMFSAREQLINRRAGRDVSFQRLSIPMMTLTLIQAAGRLIRSVEDRGVVAILDPRLSSTGYGKKIVQTLPPMPVTSDINDVTAFYAAV